ncbi:MAG TPA: STAS domain-containing protein [Myxococcota bacterium]|nr:STAS domain-containing protein [Myxococcota bacterium]
MLRITQRDDRETLRLEGRLTRYEVALLRETLRRGPNGTRVIDLAGVAFLDEDGARTLIDLRQRGLELRGGSPFVKQLLLEVES